MAGEDQETGGWFATGVEALNNRLASVLGGLGEQQAQTQTQTQTEEQPQAGGPLTSEEIAAQAVQQPLSPAALSQKLEGALALNQSEQQSVQQSIENIEANGIYQNTWSQHLEANEEQRTDNLKGLLDQKNALETTYLQQYPDLQARVDKLTSANQGNLRIDENGNTRGRAGLDARIEGLQEKLKIAASGTNADKTELNDITAEQVRGVIERTTQTMAAAQDGFAEGGFSKALASVLNANDSPVNGFSKEDKAELQQTFESIQQAEKLTDGEYYQKLQGELLQQRDENDIKLNEQNIEIKKYIEAQRQVDLQINEINEEHNSRRDDINENFGDAGTYTRYNEMANRIDEKVPVELRASYKQQLAEMVLTSGSDAELQAQAEQKMPSMGFDSTNIQKGKYESVIRIGAGDDGNLYIKNRVKNAEGKYEEQNTLIKDNTLDFRDIGASGKVRLAFEDGVANALKGDKLKFLNDENVQIDYSAPGGTREVLDMKYVQAEGGKYRRPEFQYDKNGEKLTKRETVAGYDKYENPLDIVSRTGLSETNHNNLVARGMQAETREAFTEGRPVNSAIMSINHNNEKLAEQAYVSNSSQEAMSANEAFVKDPNAALEKSFAETQGGAMAELAAIKQKMQGITAGGQQIANSTTNFQTSQNAGVGGQAPAAGKAVATP